MWTLAGCMYTASTDQETNFVGQENAKKFEETRPCVVLRRMYIQRLHFVEADHERGLSILAVLEELQTSDAISAA